MFENTYKLNFNKKLQIYDILYNKNQENSFKNISIDIRYFILC